ncbi:MAG TPA: hypothetical protein VFC24_12655 [Casimicrobiaceae bacterium]|nr:hypothetical protein [Casimicrobiaceae bacterium]
MNARHSGVAHSPRHSQRHLHAWPALFVAPVAFAVNLGVTYPLVPWVCAHQQAGVLHVAEIVFLLVGLFGVWHGWRLWRAHRAAPGSDAGDHGSQQQFLAIIGTLASAIFSLGIAAQWFTAFVVPACLS